MEAGLDSHRACANAALAAAGDAGQVLEGEARSGIKRMEGLEQDRV